MATKDQVFLFSGQLLQVANGVRRTLPAIVQCVVVAGNAEKAYEIISLNYPKYKPVGCATLADYENAALLLRKAIGGEDVGCEMFVEPGM